MKIEDANGAGIDRVDRSELKVAMPHDRRTVFALRALAVEPRRALLGLRLLAALVVTLLAPLPAAAFNSAETPACKKVIAAIEGQTGASVLRLSTSLDTVYLKQKDVSSIALFCSKYYDPFAYVSSGNRVPPAAYYAVFAKVAAILFPGSTTAFAAGAIKCQAAAQKDDEGRSSEVVGQTTLDCRVAKADADDDDDQGATSIKVGPRQQ